LRAFRKGHQVPFQPTGRLLGGLNARTIHRQFKLCQEHRKRPGEA
jgi:hypothetical protein